jgi:hypothetical protein
MKKLLAIVAVCGLVGLGIVAGRSDADGINTPNAVFQPVAAQNSSRIQWEYKELQKTAGEITVEEFNHLGLDGWEMCGVRQRGQGVSYFYFKREKLPAGQQGFVDGRAELPTFKPGTESVKKDEPATTYQQIPTPAAPPAAPFTDEPLKLPSPPPKEPAIPSVKKQPAEDRTF